MAQTIIGLDIGAYSVKVATITASFRAFTWTNYREITIPHSERDQPERAAAHALAEVSSDLKAVGAVVVCGLPGYKVMSRFISLPFDDPKRIDSVLGFELEGQIPLSVEQMVYSYQVTGKNEEGQSEVFAAAVQREYMSRYMDTLKEAGVDPRILTLDTTSYLNLYDHLVGAGTVAFLDIGHRSTNVCVVQEGQLRMARSIGRGGMAVTQAIANELSLDFEEAERHKHEEGAVPFGPTPVNTQVAGLVEEALRPLVLGVNQSLRAYEREHSDVVGKVLVMGGGARIRNLLPWLELQLNMSVQRAAFETLEFNRSSEQSPDISSAGKGVGLALTQVAGSKHLNTLNFRRGDFAYEGDFEFIKDKFKVLMAMAAVLLIAASAYAYERNSNAQQVLDYQYKLLGDFSEQHMDERYTSFKKTLKDLTKASSPEDEMNFFPPMTAVAVLEKITAIQMAINNEAGAATPGGPIGGDPPKGPRLDRVRGALKALKGLRDDPMRNRASPPRGIGDRPDASIFERSGLRPPRRGSPRPSTGGPRVGNKADTGSSKPGDTNAGDEKKGVIKTGAVPTKIELSIINIDVFGDVEVTAETHESNVTGKELFRQRLDQERCFTGLKRRDIGPVVAGVGGRHADWVRFEVTFQVKCPKKNGDKDGKGGGR
jgi:general secretion pathway protein L